MINKWCTAKKNKMTMGVDSLRQHVLEVVLPQLQKHDDEAQKEADLEYEERMTYEQLKHFNSSSKYSMAVDAVPWI